MWINFGIYKFKGKYTNTNDELVKENGAISMKEKEERQKLASFFKVGIVVLSAIAVFSLGYQFIPNAVSVTTVGTKKVPIYSVDCSEKKVAISFDAAWGNEQTQGILDCLAKYKIKSTFFMTGGWVAKYPEDVINISKAGHDLGNHSENHKQMSTLSQMECEEEIMEPHRKVEELTGVSMKLFRPPYGDYNNTLLDTCKKLGYYCIQWDVDSLDWKDYDAATITNRIVNSKELENGSIILLHNGGKHTLEALPMVIEGLQAKGYQIVPISELIYKENYVIDSQGRQHSK